MKAPENPSAWPATDEANSLDEAPPTAKQAYAAPLALVVVSLVTFFFGLGRLALLGPDEPRYAEIAREMFTSGDWISPRLCGCLWFEKPALIYWMSGLSYRLLGVGELAARLPVAVAATLTVLLLYFVIKRVASMRVAFFAGLALATCGMFIGYARVASPDMPLAAAMTAALLAGFLATQAGGRKRTLLWVTSFAAMAVAVLAKGLPGIALVVLIFVVYLIWMRRTDAINWREALLGVTVFSLIAATWYVPVTLRHGNQFLYEFFFRHHFERFTSNEFGHPQPFYFFFPVAVAGLLPWPAFLLPAIARLRRLQPRHDARHALLAFAWVWAAVIILFFSFSGSKLPGYILPAFPALAIIVGFEIESFVAGARHRLPRAAAWITALLVAALAIGFAVYLHLEVVNAGSSRLIAYILLGAIAPTAITALATGGRRLFVASATVVILSVVICAAVVLVPKLNDEQSRKPLSLEAAAALRPGERIGFFVLLKEYAPAFYAQGRVACGIGEYDVFNAMSNDELAAALRNEPSLVILTLERWRGGLEQDARFNIELLARQRDALALRVSLK
ncbi:MAG TPA: glycosyltransferase family 39 protein [Blastocatellia bacterium]|nr:glycosyltransferase family 39 protein [Blastocatellia bacterium]